MLLFNQGAARIAAQDYAGAEGPLRAVLATQPGNVQAAVNLAVALDRQDRPDQAVQLLQRVFKYRTCELDIKADAPGNRSFRPCLLHSIGQCTAPCANRVSPENYRADIDRFLRFLGSKRSQMLRELRAEMEEAAEGRRFERAAVVRDQIKAIERLDERERRRDRHKFQCEQNDHAPFPKLRPFDKLRACMLSKQLKRLALS